MISLALGSILLAAVLAPASAGAAEVYIGVDGAAGAKRFVLGLDALMPAGKERTKDMDAGRRVRGVVREDLLFSRYLEVVDQPPPADAPDKERYWKGKGAAFLLRGGAAASDDKLRVDAELVDLASGETIFSRHYRQNAELWRSLAHRLSDDLVKQMTGREGIAGSRIAFVNDQSGTKELYLVDYDGARVQRMTKNRSINLLPRWHPDGRRIAFTSYKDGNPDIFIYDLGRRRIRPFSSRQGINLAGGFSPDGKHLAATISRERNPNIFILDAKTGKGKPQTSHWGVDSSPTFSPDSKHMAFISDRAGNPQIHTIELETGRTKRLTRLNWCDTPSWSPSGEWIAFAGRANRKDKMDIFLVDITGTRLVQITHGEGSNESPSWSPDGRFLVFTSTREKGRRLYLMDADGSAPHRLGEISGNSFTPNWGPAN